MFFKKAVLKNFAIFTAKYLCWSLFLVKSRVLTRNFWEDDVFEAFGKTRLKASPRTVRRVKHSWWSVGFLCSVICLEKISMSTIFRAFSTC